MFSISELLTPFGEEKYKIVTSQEALNDIIEKTILPAAIPLKTLKLVVTRKRLHIRGIIDGLKIEQLSRLKTSELHFDIGLSKQEVHRDEVFLAIRKFRVYSPRKFDIWQWVNRYTTIIQSKIIQGLTTSETPFYESRKLKELCFDLKFVLNQVPTEINLLGNVSIMNLGFEKKRIVWYIQSNVVLKSIIDYLGPGFISVEKLDIDVDAQKLLTDFDFSEEES